MNLLPRRYGSGSTARYCFGAVRWSLVVLLVFELALRTFVMRLPRTVYKPGWGIVPADHSTSMQGREGYAVQEYLQNGEIKTPYSGGGISIVVLGDSTVQAAQVNDVDNFVSLTETALRVQGVAADLHNLGAPERTIADYVFLAPVLREAYRPDYVIIQAGPASFSLSLLPEHTNHFVETEDGGLRLIHMDEADDMAFNKKEQFYSSSLLAFLNFRWQVMREESSADHAEGLWRWANESRPPRIMEEREILARENDTGSTDVFDSISLQVNEIREAYVGSEIIFLVVPYTPGIPHDGEEAVSWNSQIDNRLRLTLSGLEGVRVVDAGIFFRKYYEKYSVLPRGSFNSAFNFGHLNRYGHEAVALALTDFLEDLLK
ncbi:MAG: hypothetical protein HFACDABA_01249 [Anaerolineales bacterium]|nr:hypothetical protein [Anaerolineales bacterium]